ncbi:hypothetical protein [Roseibium limicola]|uniref:hypothetical protein n=1 Tax=Roseibium limicola TaxID=2816037 RepID=UPI001AD93EF0
MSTERTAATSSVLPPLLLSTLVTAVLAGLAADITWEVWARVFTPLWVGGPLQPAALVQSVFGFKNLLLAEAIHACVGIVAYPLAYLFVARPIARIVTPFLPWWCVGIGFGIGLWVFALYVMAHIFAGLPPFLGFGQLAWASLVGHMGFGVVCAAVVKWRERN